MLVKKSRNRLLILFLFLVVLGSFTILIINTLKDNLLYFFTPTEIKNKEDIAKLYFHRAIACVDLDPDVMAELSAIYVKTDRSQAMALATLSVKLYPRYGRSLSTLGLVQEADGQVEAAIKSYESAVRVSQDLQSLSRL